MGIMLIDASAEGQQDTHSLLNFPPQATPTLKVGTQSPIGLTRPLGYEEGPMATRVRKIGWRMNNTGVLSGTIPMTFTQSYMYMLLHNA